MKKTLLAMVQDIMSEMDSDEINSIDDTVEAQQVAAIIRSCYNKMISNRNWPHLKTLIKLDAVNDLTKPNYLRLPNETKELLYVGYNALKDGETGLKYKEVKYKHPDEFLRLVMGRQSTNPHTVEVEDHSGIKMLILDNAAPQFWTSFNDLFLVFDSWDADVDDTLKQSKTQAVAYMDPVWVHENDAIPNLPSEAFTALEEESKSVAFFTLKQMVNSKAEQASATQQRWLSRKAWRAAGGVRYSNFGRKGRI